MNPATAVDKIVTDLNRKRALPNPAIRLSLPQAHSHVIPPDRNLAGMIRKFLNHALEISQSTDSIKVAVREKQRMTDLEKFLFISPQYWLHLIISSNSAKGFEDGAKDILKDLGYQCSEWIGMEGSESQLGIYFCGTRKAIALVVFIENRGARRSCDFLIPVNESVPFYAHAL
jgi:hypothetical protein